MSIELHPRAFNAHVGEDNISGEVLAQQRKVAVVTEMIHTASLVRYGDILGLTAGKRKELSEAK